MEGVNSFCDILLIDLSSVMKKEIRVLSKEEAEESDIAYWREKSPQERLEAVQYLREQWIDKFHNQDQYDESRKRLRRVYRVVKRT